MTRFCTCSTTASARRCTLPMGYLMDVLIDCFLLPEECEDALHAIVTLRAYIRLTVQSQIVRFSTAEYLARDIICLL
jgi:hypothetical protein